MMNFIKNHHGFPDRFEKKRGIPDSFPHGGQVAVQKKCFIRRQHFGKHGLARTTHPTQPDQRDFSPSIRNSLQPMRSIYRKCIFHLEALNVKQGSQKMQTKKLEICKVSRGQSFTRSQSFMGSFFLPSIFHSSGTPLALAALANSTSWRQRKPACEPWKNIVVDSCR